MSHDVRPLPILSILDARVVTGPARGLIHLARHLPEHAWLHVALLRSEHDDLTQPLPLAEAARGTRMTVHSLVERGSYDPGVILRARDLAREVGARVVQSHSYKPHVIAAGVRALYGAPWIAFHHGWTAESLKVRLFHAVDHLTLPRADRTVAVSTASEKLVLGVGCRRERTVMITNAVDPGDIASDWSRDEARAHFGLPSDAIVACAVGRLSHEKGQDVLLDAFARIAAKVPKLVLVLAGDGPDRAALEAQAASAGLGDRVRFLGHQQRVGRVYTASDIMVLPSRSEGMPNALLEAMCLGTAAVATDVGGVTEVATDGETAWIVPPEDPDALARALEHAASDGDERTRRAESASDHVARTMSPAKRAERFLALYDDLLGAGAAAVSALNGRANAARSGASSAAPEAMVTP